MVIYVVIWHVVIYADVDIYVYLIYIWLHVNDTIVIVAALIIVPKIAFSNK